MPHRVIFPLSVSSLSISVWKKKFQENITSNRNDLYACRLTKKITILNPLWNSFFSQSHFHSKRRRLWKAQSKLSVSEETDKENVSIDVKSPSSMKEDFEILQVKAAILHPISRHFKKNLLQNSFRLEEAVSLAKTLNWEICFSEIIPLRETVGSTFFSKGKLEEIKQKLNDSSTNTLLVNTKLTPGQQLRLSLMLDGCQIVDRFGLILQIFALRAKTRESKLQVELASLQYKKSSLVHLYDADHFDQQRGGLFSTSGSGEAKLEIERRLIADRQRKILKELENIRSTRTVQRQSRKGLPLIAVVGYTNAGKSALVNALTGANLLSEDQVFSSLDPHMRRAILPSGTEVILIDTVGFISDLPQILMTTFRSTLEEVSLSNLILHLRDISHPETHYQREKVLQILCEMKIKPELLENHIEVWNKIDRITKSSLSKMLKRSSSLPKAHHYDRERSSIIPISAKYGDGCDKLLNLLDKIFCNKVL